MDHEDAVTSGRRKVCNVLCPDCNFAVLCKNYMMKLNISALRGQKILDRTARIFRKPQPQRRPHEKTNFDCKLDRTFAIGPHRAAPQVVICFGPAFTISTWERTNKIMLVISSDSGAKSRWWARRNLAGSSSRYWKTVLWEKSLKLPLLDRTATIGPQTTKTPHLPDRKLHRSPQNPV